MPEGDTVHRTCSRLHEALAGRELLAAELRWPGLSTAALAGMGVIEVTPRGKHILIRLDPGWTLHSHLRMEGQWRIERTGAALTAPPGEPHGEPANPATSPAGTLRGGPANRASRWAARSHPDLRAILVTGPWTALGLRLGALDLVRTGEEHTLLGHLGPDILDPHFDAVTAVANLAASRTELGAALLDQRNLAGIGTLWASEALFLERLNPWATGVPDDRIAAVVARARRLMEANLPQAVQNSTGSRREGETTYVHARSGRPCRRCGTIIRVAPIGPPGRERVLFSCPSCQGGLAPGDDGRPLAPLGSSPARPRSRRERR